MIASEKDIVEPSPVPPAATGRAGRPPRAARSTTRWWFAALVFAVIVIIALGAALWRQQQLIDAVGRESARRFGQLDTLAREAQTRARQSLSVAQDASDKLAALDARLVESQSQQAALEQLYQELSRGEDEWALIEVEQALSMASQQLQLAGNVPNAIAALEVADARLARADRPQFAAVRRTIARDMQRLAALPSLDVTGTAGKLDQLIAAVDSLPLLASVEPRRPAVSSSSAPADADAAAPAAPADAGWWQRTVAWTVPWRDALLRDTNQLIRIQRIDQPGVLLVSPEQGALLRENLKLRLLSARMALLARQDGPWRSDLAFVSEGLGRYFDPESRATVRAQNVLKQVVGVDLNVQAPDIGDSLKAARAMLPRNAPTEPAR
jgi:uroporphyrin-3 C-methyltransferase/uroporphyrinogen III methyltransferase/synthase